MKTRVLARGVSAWVFGLATTIFLIAVWGRAVVIDVDALQRAAVPLGQSPAVVDLFMDWVNGQLIEAGVYPPMSEPVVEGALEGSSITAALERFAAELVAAAADPGKGGSTIDVAGLLEPAVPEIGAALHSAGVSVPESHLEEAIAGIDPLVVRGSDIRPYLGAASPTASRLGTAAVLSLVTMIASGWAAIMVSDDRFGEAKGLLNRVALGALSFSIILKVGSWVLDPRGGRAPLAESTSIIADSNWLVPFGLAVLAGAGAALVWGVSRQLRSRSRSPSGDGAQLGEADLGVKPSRP